jgi:putative nucleotidyltransferase with HDIG domain
MDDATKDVMNGVAEVLGKDSSTVLVGGSVRDMLLGAKPKDYDFATPLLPDEVEKRVRAAGKRAYTVGKRYGTIGFKLDGNFIEVTTFRSELYDLSSRKPQVTFTNDLQRDLSRRDFTVNAMAITMGGELVDPFDGRKDLDAKIIRAVGVPKHRFREDPLRMLRLVRLAAKYNFDVDSTTAKAVTDLAYSLTKISTERVTAEMDGILVAAHARKGLELLASLGLLPFSLPLLAVQVGYDQNSKYHSFNLWEHTIKTVEGVDADVELRWAALLHDIGKPFVRQDKPGRSTYVHHDLVGARLVVMLARDLKWSNERRQRIVELVREHLDDDNPLRTADNAAK